MGTLPKNTLRYSNVCKHCKTRFNSSNKLTNTCSAKCLKAWRTKTVKCKNCKVKFVSAHPRTKFCSQRCKSAKNTRDRLKGVKRVCPNCCEKFHPRSTPTRFCSQSCNITYTTLRLTKVLECIDCREKFEFSGRTKAKRCLACRRLWANVKTKEYAIKVGKIEKPYVGSGGNQKGDKNHRWNPNSKYHGFKKRADITYRRACYKYWPKKCMACGTLKNIHVHHVNGDPRDSSPWNLVPLCVTCHISKVHKAAAKRETSEELLLALEEYWPDARVEIEKCKQKCAELKSRNEARKARTANSNRSTI